MLLEDYLKGCLVSLEPGTKACARDRDYALAEKGIKIFQFDSRKATIDRPHPNISFFHKPIISKELNTIATSKNLSFAEIMNLIEEYNENLLIMDLEGGEWEFFEQIPSEYLSRFTQIHAEFHGFAHIDRLDSKLEILNKICATHIPLHVHYHNSVGLLAFDNFLVSNLMEITFARRDLGEFEPSEISYPTTLDAPNNPMLPEVYIGKFNVITS